MSRWFIRLSFKGTAYAGWQKQENANTVQNELEKALAVLLRQPIATTGCGRTDTGVHAREFFVHFDWPSHEFPHSISTFVKSLNGILPFDIAVQDIFEVSEESHARFSAVSRTYEYLIAPVKSPFMQGLASIIHSVPDPEVLNTSVSALLGRHDFTSFSKQNTQVKTNFCHVTHANWSLRDGLMVFTITSDRFLHGMVRAIVGTCLQRYSHDQLIDILNAKDRSVAGPAAPPEGLYLIHIQYPFLDHKLHESA
ncbi:MAG: tRNA pseudouridine(38-40) synthase TruA [Bacteroidota bacterium]